ncbi:MAG: hypothetical protein UEU47_05905 [Oscillospiraceae bacterium]|nr:hypothetical protein [Oscillospiraceae bacterium]
MKLFVNGTEKEITLRPWMGEQYGPDCFMDLETGYRDGQEITAEQYTELTEWWNDETNAYNSGEVSEGLGDPSENYTKEFSFDFD